jgi:hypothetical protein
VRIPGIDFLQQSARPLSISRTSEGISHARHMHTTAAVSSAVAIDVRPIGLVGCIDCADLPIGVEHGCRIAGVGVRVGTATVVHPRRYCRESLDGIPRRCLASNFDKIAPKFGPRERCDSPAVTPRTTEFEAENLSGVVAPTNAKKADDIRWPSIVGMQFRRQMTRTFSARGPFGPRPSSYDTRCPSRRSSNLVPSTFDMWKNMSLPSPVSMNPNPFSVSFLIFPSGIEFTSKKKA